MDEQDQSQQALMEMFRQDRATAQAHPPREPRWRISPVALRWIIAIVAVIVVLGPVAFLVIYPRFGPVDTMTSFCRAESDGEYASAYALLSKGAQQRVTLDAFTKESSNAHLLSCTQSNGIPIIFGGTRSSLDVHYDFIGETDSGIDGTMAFVREPGGWRVDSTSPDFFGLGS